MRALAATLLLCSACAARGPALAPTPARVLVLAHSAVPGSRDAEASAQTMAREAVRCLEARGRHAATAVAKAGPVPLQADDLARELAHARADAALVLALTRLDTSALAPLGHAAVDLDVRLVDARGAIVWEGRHRGATSVPTYRSRNDWRSHLRAAVVDSLEKLP